ncbi:hypothetical protein COMNV_00154 [Commensalibacter sp. Nvir]|uniref:hypothetical protein n=1 Tax=Commensalibacter sp. Nvir TaxID=3069817 RepID=UPI002D39CE51|nr:hypothetical protein COMNV_00154 [Commensalibacter sp. Nvir]
MRSSAAFAAPLIVFLTLSGCSGLDKFFDDTVTLSGSNPDAPKGDSENLLRARGKFVDTAPILQQTGNIWPSRPPALPTLSDVSSDEKDFSLSDYSKASGADTEVVNHGQGSDKLLPSDFPENGKMDFGEKRFIKKGVLDFGNGVLPDHIEDRAPQYIKRNEEEDKSVVISNGDGTSTVIDPKGMVKIVKDKELGSKTGTTRKSNKR